MSSIGIMEVGPPEGRVPELEFGRAMGYVAFGLDVATWVGGRALFKTR